MPSLPETSKRLNTAVLSVFNISGNFIFGGKDTNPGKSYNSFVHDVDKDQTGFAAICDELSGCSELKMINFSDIGMGPKGAVMTSSML